ncbi:MAG TPA: UDP-N-acetylmuramate dehydrogenase [Candidatus Paceibacterota bacterium]
MMQENIPLACHTSYKIGGQASYFFEAKKHEEVADILARKKDFADIFVLGGGTNVLFDDEVYNGLVLKVSVNSLRQNGNDIIAGAGVPMSDLLEFAAMKGLSGLEWAGGLPGALGGAVRGNAGAFAGEIQDSVKEVVSLDFRGEKPKAMKRTAKECEFGYRDSIFKKNDNEAITEVTLRLKPGNKKDIRSAVEDKIKIRKQRHPLEYPNAGSVFKNVPVENFGTVTLAALKQKSAPIKNDPFPVVPAAYLISGAGLKGVSCGGAMVSPMHANFIVNVLDATASDVRQLMSFVQAEVNKKFQVELTPEIRIFKY